MYHVHVWAAPLEGISVSVLHIEKISFKGKNRVPVMGPMHDPVTWCGISHVGKQVTQWDIKNKGKSGWTGDSFFVFDVPLCQLASQHG